MKDNTTETLKKMESFFSKKYGLVNEKNINNFSNIIVSLENYDINIGNIIPAYFCSVYNRKRNYRGTGVSLDAKKSKIKAFGEFIERYCGMYDDSEEHENVFYDSFLNLNRIGVKAFDLSNLISFIDEQYDSPNFPFSRYFSDKKISWIKSEDIVSNQEILLPVQSVFLKYSNVKEKEIFNFTTSTGLACGSDTVSTKLGSLLEVIERDSFMLTWLFKIPSIAIEMDIIENIELKIIYNHICEYLVGEDKLHIFDISRTKGVYTILALIRNDLSHSHGLVVSAASHISPSLAILKALEELIQVYVLAYGKLVEDSTRLEKIDVNTIDKHLFYYNTGERNKNIDFLFANDRTVKLSKMKDYSTTASKENLDYIINLFREKGCPILVTDVTKAVVRKEGFHVLKTVIPEYVELEYDYNIRRMKSKRIDKYAEKYGEVLNDEPHPFP